GAAVPYTRLCRAVDGAADRALVLGEGDGAEVGGRVGHFLPVEEGGSADDAVGHVPGPQRLLQRPGLRVGAVEDREVAPLPLLREAPHRDLVRRSEEHTSELQSRENLVCRLLLEKKKN